MSDSWPPPEPVVELYAAPTGADFGDFYDTQWRPVMGMALALTGDRAAAEDLNQDAFATAYREWHRVGSYDKPGAFVRRIVANNAVSRGRRLMRENRALVRLAGRRRDIGLPTEIDDTWALVRRLPARQAQVLALTYLGDLPLAEVAEALGIGTETAKTHLSRARAALARELSLPSNEEQA